MHGQSQGHWERNAWLGWLTRARAATEDAESEPEEGQPLCSRAVGARWAEEDMEGVEGVEDTEDTEGVCRAEGPATAGKGTRGTN